MKIKHYLLEQPDFILWVREAIIRIRAKDPRYLRVWNRINIAMIIIGSIPTTLIEANAVDAPLWAQILSWAIAIAGFWGRVNSGLTVKDATKIELPYTEKKQIEEKIKEGDTSSI